MRVHERGGGGGGAKQREEEGRFSAKESYLKNYSYLLVFILVRILILMRCFTEYV